MFYWLQTLLMWWSPEVWQVKAKKLLAPYTWMKVVAWWGPAMMRHSQGYKRTQLLIWDISPLLYFYSFSRVRGDRARYSTAISSLTLAPNRVRCVGLTAPLYIINQTEWKCHYRSASSYSLIYLIRFSFFSDVQVNSQSELVLSLISIQLNKLLERAPSLCVFLGFSKLFARPCPNCLSLLSTTIFVGVLLVLQKDFFRV